ncbi:MAG: CoB--CoM heterodisulfide reductase iron-sulfur subunit A family protein [Anaerolineae bacterium]|nr:CoB--CoM heterodisulfide reductase iron-sulfur subunit A family protein [Anaerolineae bacterium]MDW8101581.1 CoB--CoM heterodisulfide reductase iron-sulfur subunit A family protein [Anaerolineae bacterium]
MARIGVFICHCGFNIAGVVDVKQVAEEIGRLPEVVFVTDYKYMCSDPGQNLIQKAAEEYKLDGIVVAACSPSMHEVTFRRAAASAGVNPYRTEIANIREQVSWPHRDYPKEATRKAIEIIRTIIEKVRYDEALVPLGIPVIKKALVIGGGIAGITAALDIANAGYPVVLVEREKELGGKMRRLSGLYINFEAPDGFLEQKVKAATEHPGITLLTQSEVKEVGGYVGNFTVKVDTPSGERAFDVGAIVVATGFDLYPLQALGEYGGGRYPDVISALEFERMLKDGLHRPSDGREVKSVAFVQCAGSRDPQRHRPYCSKICCMYVAKQASLFKQRVPDGQALVFYIDIRSQGKNYEEFVQRAIMDYGVLYIRGKVARVYQEGGRVFVRGVDTLSGRPVEAEVDLAILASAAVASPGAEELAKKLKVSTDAFGFFQEAHPKLRPVESLTAGVFIAGAAQFPKDIPETVAQASGAAAKVLGLFAQRELVQEPTVAYVIEDLCSGCSLCVEACPYGARALHPWRGIATVNVALCQGCGACAMVCPNKASRVRNFTPVQYLAMVEKVVG